MIVAGPSLPEFLDVGPSLDEAAALSSHGSSALLVARDASEALVAVLQVVVRDSRTLRAVVGRGDDVTRVLDDVRATLPAGRLVLAQEWIADRTAALLGRRGLAGLIAPAAAERPRTLAESPLPPAASVMRAVGGIVDLHRYPATVPTRAARAAARRHDWPEEGVVVSGGGSLALLGRLLRVFTDPGDAIAVHFPAFHGVLDACRREGRVARVVPEPEGEAGLPRLASIADRVRLAVVASPNAVDSREFAPDALDVVRAALGPLRPLVLDEAYAGFVEEAPPPTESPELAPVVRLRSLSKVDGLAGLRVG